MTPRPLPPPSVSAGPAPLTAPPTPPHASRRAFLQRLARGAGLGALATLAPALAACVREPDGITGPIGASPELRARPGTPTGDVTIGVSQLALGLGRDGLLYVPASYNAATPVPLLVLLHAAQAGATAWEPFFTLAEREGFVILAPESRGLTWDLAATSRFGADVTFIDAALAQTFTRVNVDATRIALGGFADGASYALSLGVSNGGLFSHLMAFSPGFFAPSNPIVGKPLVFVSHGTEDQVLDPAFTSGTIVPALEQNGYVVRFESFEGGYELPDGVTEDALTWWLE